MSDKPDIKAADIQMKALSLLQAGFGPIFQTYRSTPMLQVQPGDLPILAVYILREQRQEMGQANEGEPAFKHRLTLGISGAIHMEHAKQDDLTDLETWMALVDDLLLTNPKFVNMTEGIVSMDRTSQYAKVGEVTLYEIRKEMVIANSSWWEPVITDELRQVVVDTQYPSAEAAASGTPQIHRVYVLETARKESRRAG